MAIDMAIGFMAVVVILVIAAIVAYENQEQPTFPLVPTNQPFIGCMWNFQSGVINMQSSKE